MALPSMTIPGNTTYMGQVMNPGIQAGPISFGGSVVMPGATTGLTYAAPMPTYAAPMMSTAPAYTKTKT